MARHGHRVLELRGELAVAGVDRPFVRLRADGSLPLVEHRFDGEDHTLLQLQPGARVAVVKDLRILMHLTTDTVPAVLLDHAVTLFARVTGDRMADVAQAGAR